MAKAKVLITFTDKVSGKKYEKGEVIEVSAKRFNEITTKGKLIELVDESVEGQKQPKK